jgi:hypothetical protein
MTQLQRALDDDWLAFSTSSAAAEALARWEGEDARYSGFADLGALRSYFERRDEVEARERLMADLLRRAPGDPAARRVLLAALAPGLRRLSRRAAAFWDEDEAESIVVAAAVERLADRDATVPTRVSAGLLGSVWTTVWNRRRRERWEEAYWGGRADPEAVERIECRPDDAALAQLIHLVDEAVRRGAVPERGARLMILHWVHGYSNAELAELHGLRPCTIRKHRRDAEQRLAEFAAA